MLGGWEGRPLTDGLKENNGYLRALDIDIKYRTAINMYLVNCVRQGAQTRLDTCFYMFDFICITCIFDRLCSQINDDDDIQVSSGKCASR